MKLTGHLQVLSTYMRGTYPNHGCNSFCRNATFCNAGAYDPLENSSGVGRLVFPENRTNYAQVNPVHPVTYMVE